MGGLEFPLFLVTIACLFPIQKTHGALFQFGDSLSDTGNKVIAFPNSSTSRAIVRPPYGMTFFHHPARRVSDGRLIIDFLATRLGLPFINPYLGKQSISQGVNFAVAGATAINLEAYKLDNLVLEDTVDLSTQLEWFLEFQKNTSERFSSAFFEEALYIVGEIGGNDYERMWERGWSIDRVEAFVEHVVSSIGKHTRRLFDAGARRFMVVNLPVQGCSPRNRAMAFSDQKDERLGCVLKMKTVGEKHNRKLKALVEELQQELPEASFMYADFYTIMLHIMENPQAYGITHRWEACCGVFTNSIQLSCGETKNINSIEVKGTACINPSNYMFWNDNHYTEHFYKIVAEYFFERLSQAAPYGSLKDI